MNSGVKEDCYKRDKTGKRYIKQKGNKQMFKEINVKEEIKKRKQESESFAKEWQEQERTNSKGHQETR